DITEVKKNPPSPFITSTLQQDASTKLGFPVAKTMKIAQELYEGIDTPEGHIAFITYMRTDSTRISDEAKSAAKELILNLFEEEYLGSEIEQSAKKSKKKQEKGKIQDAHECIRPVNVFLTPEKASKLLDKEHLKLYELIWKRFIASQMKNAVYKQYSYDFKSGEYIFEAAIRERLFDGFEAVYSVDDEKSEEHKELKVGEKYTVTPKIAESKTTPPDRYSEAALVKILEAEGIGRPSTYATIIQTLLYRNYIVKRGRSLVPTILGFVVNDFLEKHFPEIVDKGFTAKMEKNLDEIENGNMDWKDVIKKFFNEFEKDLKKAEKVFFSIDYETDKNCENCGSSYRLRVGKYGLYLNCPKCGINQSVSIKEFGVLLDEKVYLTQITDEEQDNEEQENYGSEWKKMNSKKTSYSSLKGSRKKQNTKNSKNTKNVKSEKVTDSIKSTKNTKSKKSTKKSTKK
ncbi:MAG: DNA topoisomerase, partial [Fervidobacterium sp.]